MPHPDPAATAFLRTRRSRPAKTLTLPVPTREELLPILETAARTGGRILVDQLVRQGCDRIFTVPGESFLAVLDALVDTPAVSSAANASSLVVATVAVTSPLGPPVPPPAARSARGRATR